MERAKGIEPSLPPSWFRVARNGLLHWAIQLKGRKFPALLALKQNECNMAYLYRKNRSPFWYIQYIDADKIKHDKSTGLRADDPNDTAKAKAMRAELEANEHRKIPLVNGAAWDHWVLKFFERHCPTKATLDHYEDAWKWVALWLQHNRIHSPRQLTYRLAIEYLDWRTTFKKRTGKIVGRNTAILELKLLSLVMGEAVRLGHADANPLVSLKLKRDKAKQKPEMTDDEIITIQDALKQAKPGFRFPAWISGKPKSRFQVPKAERKKHFQSRCRQS